MNQDTIRCYAVIGSRRISNYIWATLSLSGGLGFFLTGLSSHTHPAGLPWAAELRFFPQGLVMMFYGGIALLIGSYLALTFLWGVGEGWNIFDKQDGTVRIFRWGYPGVHRTIDLQLPLADVIALRLEFDQGLNARRRVHLCVRDGREIPLTRGVPTNLEAMERYAAELAVWLQVELKQ